MNAAYFRRMFDYTYWAHRQVWACITELNDEQYNRPCDYSVGSVHEQVVHTMGAELLWLQRVCRVAPDPFLSATDFPDRDAVRARWDQIEADWGAFAAGLQDEHLAENIEYVSISGNTRRVQPLWEGLTQIINHATDHRAQTLALIHQVGGRTIEQDFVFYSWKHPSSQG